ncbi:CopG family transcriptional regulator [Dactylosporangium sp. NPDC049140]|uniref:ribbon-helix-helix domain-containing protein n=1 Tax=Dactylosporangium sp. NPDC049140 TaxID=3155647 RepID=UPI0034117066
MHDEQAQLAADQEFAAAVAGGAPFDYDDTAVVPDLPPPGAPVMVVRPVRLPSDLDAAVKDLAARQGVTPSALIRGWVEAAVDDTTDPVTELRRSLDAAQRAANELTADRHRDAA